MRAVVMRSGALVVVDLPALSVQPNQVLVSTVACGICGSDLHFLKHSDRMVELSAEGGNPSALDLSKDIVMGHEFVGRIEAVGPDAYTTAKPGDLVVSMPVMLTAIPPTDDSYRALGYSNDFNGGYAEQMLLAGPLVRKVPNGLAADHAALTEPMAVGLHAVNR